eukprot:Tbor_TRINITY_DN5736_c0_g2::TRINITY_DN5736_c0_g2_i1::g.20948::m.20948
MQLARVLIEFVRHYLGDVLPIGKRGPLMCVVTLKSLIDLKCPNHESKSSSYCTNCPTSSSKFKGPQGTVEKLYAESVDATQTSTGDTERRAKERNIAKGNNDTLTEGM